MLASAASAVHSAAARVSISVPRQHSTMLRQGGNESAAAPPTTYYGSTDAKNIAKQKMEDTRTASSTPMPDAYQKVKFIAEIHAADHECTILCNLCDG